MEKTEKGNAMTRQELNQRIRKTFGVTYDLHPAETSLSGGLTWCDDPLFGRRLLWNNTKVGTASFLVEWCNLVKKVESQEISNTWICLFRIPDDMLAEIRKAMPTITLPGHGVIPFPALWVQPVSRENDYAIYNWNPFPILREQDFAKFLLGWTV